MSSRAKSRDIKKSFSQDLLAKTGVYHGGSQEKGVQAAQQHALCELEAKLAHAGGLPAVPRIKGLASGVQEVRLLRRRTGGGDQDQKRKGLRAAKKRCCPSEPAF